MNLSYGQYGEGGFDWQNIAQAIPGVSAFLEKISDPTRDVGLLETRLSNAKMQGASLATINSLEAKLAAARHRQNLEAGRERSSSQWSNIGKVAAIAGIGVAGSLIVLLLVKATRAARTK